MLVVIVVKMDLAAVMVDTPDVIAESVRVRVTTIADPIPERAVGVEIPEMVDSQEIPME